MGLLSEKTKAHSDLITSVAFSPDGTKIVSGSWDKTIKVWESGALLANAAGALRTLADGDAAIRAAISEAGGFD